MKERSWFVSWLIATSIILFYVAYSTYEVDPFFHYHSPKLDKYYFRINNQRSQNDGIVKHFNYDAIITGTSMTENFKSSEVDSLFDCNSIKVPFSGGSYKEVNDCVKTAIDNNDKLRIVIRGLDIDRFLSKPDAMRTDLGKFPVYLYDNISVNDIEYLLNKDVYSRVIKMEQERKNKDFYPGITSFDAYSSWHNNYSFGINSVSPNGVVLLDNIHQPSLTEEEKKMISNNINENVLNIAIDNPEIQFYYFYTPYSIVWWANTHNKGMMNKYLEAEEYVTELLINTDNIHLFSFNTRYDIITDLNFYKDSHHYGEWVNSWILKMMTQNLYRLDVENYKTVLKQEREYILNFDYSNLNGQEDYYNDQTVVKKINDEITGTDSLDLLNNSEISIELSGAQYEFDNDRIVGIRCKGRLDKSIDDDLGNYLINQGYIGAKIVINNIDDYSFLSFYGEKIKDNGGSVVYIYDENNNLIKSFEMNYKKLNYEKRDYIIDISKLSGKVIVIFNGGYTDITGNNESEFIFSDIMLY